MLSCRDAAKLLSESLDVQLPFRRRIGLRIHLMMCHLCRRYARQMKALQQLVRGLSAQVSEEDIDSVDLGSLSPEARERVENALREEA